MSNWVDDLATRVIELMEWLGYSRPGRWLSDVLLTDGLEIPPVFIGMILTLIFTPVICYLIYVAILAPLWLGRGWFGRTDATGRWATKGEIWRGFTLFSRNWHFLLFKLLPFTAVLAATKLILFDRAIPDYTLSLSAANSIAIDPFFIFAIVTLASAVIYSFTNYRDYSKKAQPYPLGRYGSMKTYLIGGVRKGIVRGRVKEHRQEHVLIIGPTGTGKTSVYFIPPLLEDAYSNCSAIVVEAKASGGEDMLKIVGPTWSRNRRKVLVFDPWTDGPSLNFNPLLGLKPDFIDGDVRETVDEIVDSIFRTSAEITGAPSSDGSYHEGQERALLRGLVYVSLFKDEGERNFTAIREVVGQDVEAVLGYIKKVTSPGKGKKALTEFIEKELSWFTSEGNIRTDLRANTLRGLATKLDIFTHPKVRNVTINNDFDLDMLFKEPCLVVIKSPMNVVGANILASIITRLLMLRSQRKERYGTGPDFKVWFYLDELPTLCLPELSKFVATARSSGTGVIAAVQDKADLYSSITVRRGTNSIESLIGNFKTKIVLPGCAPELAKYYSDALGLQSMSDTTINRGVFELITFRYMKRTKTGPLMTRDAIQRMPKNSALIDVAHFRPFMVTMIPWFRLLSRYRRMVRRDQKRGIDYYQPEDEVVRYTSPDVGRHMLADGKKVTKNDLSSLDSPLSEELDLKEPATDRQTMKMPSGHPAIPANSVARMNEPPPQNSQALSESGRGYEADIDDMNAALWAQEQEHSHDEG